jgi:diguanylate cyclase (GGDEF)-like protein
MPAAAAIRQNSPDPVRILLVERGSESTERVIAALERLEGAYARIDTAGSLREALARLKLEKFDLVLAELDLPDASGLAALDALAQAFGGALAVLAAQPSDALRDSALARGALDVVARAGLDEGAMRELLRAAAAPADGPRALRDTEARSRRYQEAIGRFGQAALVRRGTEELLAEAAAVASAALGAQVGVAGEGAQRRLECAGSAPLSAEVRSFLATMQSLLGAGLQRIESEGKLSFLTQFDPLTGLVNRTVLTERLSQAIAQAGRRGTPLAVLSIDIDDFNLVNDTLGHAGGDELLKAIAMRLSTAVRSGDTVARVSGDQFIVVLAELASADDAALVAKKILERLSQAFALRARETFVTASVGITTCPSDGQSAEGLISAAAAAMYRAKQSGRNGYQFFTSEIARGSRARAQLAIELRHALERDEFRLLYQPKVDLRTHQPCGAEALLRWEHPVRGLLPPSQFVPVLEETGLIVPVGEWVITRACADIRAWRRAGRKVLPVAVNLSARQLRQQYLDRHIRSLVQSAGVEPALIEIEITESQLMEDPDHAARVMNALREAGIRAAIDDFGTGYSSLSYLTRLPLAALKIDRSFVADALNEAADAAIVRAIIDMAHTLDFTVVAEGVETDAQMAFLRRFGCEQGQGFLFARPMSALDFTALI